LAARVAAARTRVTDGAVSTNNRHLPRDEVRLVGDGLPGGERMCDLRNLGSARSLRTPAAVIKARRICGQAHQRLKPEFGSGTSRDDPGRACADDQDRLHPPAAPPPRHAPTDEPGKNAGPCAKPPPSRSLPAVRHAILNQLPARCAGSIPALPTKVPAATR
jgi:hypothetical protein